MGQSQLRDSAYRLGGDDSPVEEMSVAPRVLKMSFARSSCFPFSVCTDSRMLPSRILPSYCFASYSGMP
jgi:hypothetical protein